MQDQRLIKAGESQHPLQGNVLNSEGLSTFAAVQPNLAQDSHGIGVHQSRQPVEVAVFEITGIFRWTPTVATHPSGSLNFSGYFGHVLGSQMTNIPLPS